MSDIYALFSLIRIPIAYFLPYFSAYILMRRIESRVKEHISVYYFYIALLLILIYAFTLAFTAIPLILVMGNVFCFVGILMLNIFVLRSRKYISQSENRIRLDLLETYGPLLFLCIGGIIFCQAEKRIYIGIIGWMTIFGIVLMANSYIELYRMFKKFYIRSNILFIIGAIVAMGHIIGLQWGMNLIYEIDLSTVTESLIEEFKIKTIPSHLLPLIGGAIATIPSIILYQKFRAKMEISVKIDSENFNELSAFLDSMHELVGRAIIGILMVGIENYNDKYDGKVKVKSIDLNFKLDNLNKADKEKFTTFIVGWFSKALGPVVVRVCMKGA